MEKLNIQILKILSAYKSLRRKYFRYLLRKIKKRIPTFQLNTNVILLSFVLVTIYLESKNYLYLVLLAILLVINIRKNILLLLFGVIFSVINFHNYNLLYYPELDQIYQLETEVLEINTRYYDKQIILKAEKITPLIIAKLDKYTEIAIGDKVIIDGEIERIDADSRNYNYLKSNKIFLEHKGKIISIHTTNGIFQGIRKEIINTFSKHFHPDSANLAQGILIGGENFSDEFDEKLRNSGLSHITSVSGFNFTIIFSSLLIFAGIFNRKLLYLIALLILFLYLNIVGLTNIPATRAFVMITIFSLSLLVGRKINSASVFLLTATLLIGNYPPIISNISFLLSFGALAGLLLFSRPLQTILEQRNISHFFSQTLGILISTVAVMIFTSLITIFAFDEYSIIGLISNILVLPAIPISMLLTFLLLIFEQKQIPIIYEIIIYSSNTLLIYIKKSIEITGSIYIDKNISILIGLSTITTILIIILKVNYESFKKKFQ